MSTLENFATPRLGPRREVYSNPYQNVYRVEVDFGSFAKQIYVTDYGLRVGVLVESSNGVLLTRQYRHLINGFSYEIPGGRVETGEGIEEAARRECLEETGIDCPELFPLIMFQPGLDTLHNPSHLFYAHDFEVRGDAVHVDEVVAQEWCPLDKCIEMIAAGKIMDSLSMLALLSYKTFERRKR